MQGCKGGGRGFLQRMAPRASECQFCDISAADNRWLEDPGDIIALAYSEAIGSKP